MINQFDPMSRPDRVQSVFPESLPAAAYATLKRVFGYDSFLPLQAEAVTNVLMDRDTLLVLPTGGGKSLCYQLPALLLDGLTVVVSPLISLMQDQVAQLRELGVAAELLNSTLIHAEQTAVLGRARAGETKLLYMAPETLLKPAVLQSLEVGGVACLAIDEAHCISSWGHDFRPEYRRLADVRRRFGDAVCVALTATATPRVQQDIQNSLGLAEAACLIGSFDRPNLMLRAQPRVDGVAQLLAFLDAHRDESGIVYCSTRKQVDDLAASLRARGWTALPYHAGLDTGERVKNQTAWVRDDVAIMVATVAFGMGIDKSNVRYIVHFNLPKSIENYYQEIGRAGRDGLPAECLLLYSHQDLSTMRFFIEEGAEEERRGRELRLQAMQRFAETENCRRDVILPYFGDDFMPPCEQCDNCLGEGDDAERTDVTIAAQKFLSCVARTDQRFGITHVIKVLRGSSDKKVLAMGHDRLSTYGIGMEHPVAAWKELAQQFISQGLLSQDPEYGSLRLTERAYAVFKGEPVSIILRQAKVVQAAPVDYDTTLFAELRKLRKELADAAGVPPYVIFSDRSLVEMAAHFPQNEEQFLAMHGVGEAKLASYGARFLTLLTAYSEANGLQWKPSAQPASSNSGSGASARGGKRRFEEVGERFAAGEPLEGIRASYNVQMRTILGHLTKYVQAGNRLDPAVLQAESQLDPAQQQQVLDTFTELQTDYLTPVFEALDGQISYDELNVLRLVHVCSRGE